MDKVNKNIMQTSHIQSSSTTQYASYSTYRIAFCISHPRIWNDISHRIFHYTTSCTTSYILHCRWFQPIFTPTTAHASDNYSSLSIHLTSIARHFALITLHLKYNSLQLLFTSLTFHLNYISLPCQCFYSDLLCLNSFWYAARKHRRFAHISW